jgi:hypothetical protein
MVFLFKGSIMIKKSSLILVFICLVMAAIVSCAIITEYIIQNFELKNIVGFLISAWIIDLVISIAIPIFNKYK